MVSEPQGIDPHDGSYDFEIGGGDSTGWRGRLNKR
jgi:hypothetical protein